MSSLRKRKILNMKNQPPKYHDKRVLMFGTKNVTRFLQVQDCCCLHRSSLYSLPILSTSPILKYYSFMMMRLLRHHRRLLMLLLPRYGFFSVTAQLWTASTYSQFTLFLILISLLREEETIPFGWGIKSRIPAMCLCVAKHDKRREKHTSHEIWQWACPICVESGRKSKGARGFGPLTY